MSKNSKKVPFPLLSRRSLLGGIGLLGSASLLPSLAYSQTASPLELPLELVSLTHHIGISVEDVLVSAEFYSRLVGGDNVMGEKEPFLRYFIKLNPGEVAIGKLGTLGSTGMTVPLVDHFCVEAVPHNGKEWIARLEQEALTVFNDTVFGDIDNIAIQVAGSTSGEQLAEGEVTQLESLYTGKPLVTTHGYDHIMLRVNDLDATAAFYKKMFGLSPVARSNGVVWISDGNVRLAWRETTQEEQPGIEYYALRTDPFNVDSFSREVRALGATEVEEFNVTDNLLLFSDPDGIKVGLVPS